tara:strand:- start:2752 stop:4224 length:1473 start_codon:yes stop_codon:yes gene_type:complete
VFWNAWGGSVATFNRRGFLKSSFAGAMGLYTFPSLFPFSKALAQSSDPADVEILLKATKKNVPLLSGDSTPMLCYEAELIRGDSRVVTNFQQGFMGPTLRFQQGQKVKIIFQNHLDEKSIIHWHGLHLEEKYDSHPSYAINANESYVYEFTVNQRPGTYWYHPHPHGRTAYQIYHGLAGMLIVEGGHESQYGLPDGQFDLNFCIQDRLFQEDNSLSYLQGGGHDLMMGMMGNVLFINGQRPIKQNLSKDAYRIRLLNGSNARLYKLAWSDGEPLIIIGNDGGLLAAPEQREYLYLAPGERVDLYRDFRSFSPSKMVELQSIPFQVGQGDPFTLIPFEVIGDGYTEKTLPSQFSVIQKLDPSEAINFDSPKKFTLEMTPATGWTIDGLTYEMKAVREKETVKLNTMEIWEFENKMGMPHPIHVHGSQFQVLSRSSKDIGFMDSGWKDTILLAGGETVRVIKRFDDYTGYFPFHCHNLEHGSMGMMRDFKVI